MEIFITENEVDSPKTVVFFLCNSHSYWPPMHFNHFISKKGSIFYVAFNDKWGRGKIHKIYNRNSMRAKNLLSIKLK